MIGILRTIHYHQTITWESASILESTSESVHTQISFVIPSSDDLLDWKYPKRADEESSRKPVSIQSLSSLLPLTDLIHHRHFWLKWHHHHCRYRMIFILIITTYWITTMHRMTIMKTSFQFFCMEKRKSQFFKTIHDTKVYRNDKSIEYSQY